MAYEWMNIVASVLGGLFTIGAVVLAWCLAKKSINKYQQERDENNQREQLMVDFNNLADQVTRMLIFLADSKRKLFAEKLNHDSEIFKDFYTKNILDVLASQNLFISKLRIRIPDISTEKLNSFDEFFNILVSIQTGEKKGEDVSEKEKELVKLLAEIRKLILTSKIN